MDSQPLQFSLRRMLIAMACFAVAFAAPMSAAQIVRCEKFPLGTVDAIVLALSPLLIVAAIGAGFQSLFDKPPSDFDRPGMRWLAACIAFPFFYTLAHLIWLAAIASR